ncbi:hypothetical protein AB4Z45_29125 [Paenibacillus sp. MCAF9]
MQQAPACIAWPGFFIPWLMTVGRLRDILDKQAKMPKASWTLKQL